jgi:hypothetical protein
MKLKVLLSLFFVVLAMGTFVPRVYAIDVPSFPSCVSINGTLKVSYDSGIHGIVGDPSVHQGSDKVYLVGDSNLTQCFCSETGAGIQTNWWKVSSLNQDQIDQLTKQGWTYIPSGSAWGLDDSAYMAQNSSYSCNSSNNGGGGNDGGSNNQVCNSAKPPAPQLISVVRNGATAKLTWSAVTPVTYYSIVYGTKPGEYIYGVANVGNTTSYTVGSLDPNSSYYFSVRAVNDCTPSDPSTSPRGQVLGASTFAGTGNIVFVYASMVLSLAFLLLGIYFKRREV